MDTLAIKCFLPASAAIAHKSAQHGKFKFAVTPAQLADESLADAIKSVLYRGEAGDQFAASLDVEGIDEAAVTRALVALRDKMRAADDAQARDDAEKSARKLAEYALLRAEFFADSGPWSVHRFDGLVGLAPDSDAAKIRSEQREREAAAAATICGALLAEIAAGKLRPWRDIRRPAGADDAQWRAVVDAHDALEASLKAQRTQRRNAITRALLELADPSALEQYASKDGLADGEIFAIAKEYVGKLLDKKPWTPPRKVEWDTDVKPTRAEYAQLKTVRAALAASPLAQIAEIEADFEVATPGNTYDDDNTPATQRLISVYVRAAADDTIWEINFPAAGK